MKFKLSLFIILFLNFSIFSQWVQTDGPNGGYSNEIVQIGSELILSTSGGIYKSIDNGINWELSVSGLPCNIKVNALVEHNGFLYASISRNGIYFSNDSGKNWNAINTGIDNLTFYSLLVNDENIYAGNANGGVYYSPDNGITWIDKSNQIGNIQIRDFILFNSKIYAAGTSLFETSNNGDTWQDVNIPNLKPNGIRAMTAENNILYASSEGIVYISSDNLATWKESEINNSNASITYMTQKNNIVYLTTSFGRYFYSNNQGQDWTMVQIPKTNSFINHLFINNNSLIASSSSGLHQSPNLGVTWNNLNNGINSLQITALKKNNSNIYAGTINQGIYFSNNNGESWVLKNNGLDNSNSLAINDIFFLDNSIFIATGNGIYKSNNNGDSWDRKLDPGTNKSNQGLDYNNGSFATGVSGSGIYISIDNGENWNLAQTNGFNTETSYISVKIHNNMILVSNQSGEMFVSNNLGNSWNNISITSSFHLTYDFELINNTLYAATSKGVMVSEDLGLNWSSFNTDPKFVKDILFDNNYIYAATNTGVYIADKNEKIWNSICGSMGKLATTKLFLNDNTLFAGTFDSSVWKRNKIIGNLPPNEETSTIGINKVSLCSNSSPVNLFDEIGIPSNSSGVWSPTLNNSDGEFNPLVDAPGIYTFTFDNAICDCDDYLKIEVSLDGQANAGVNSSITLCNENTSINLFEKINGNPDINGTWSPQLASGTNIFNPIIDKQGLYTYTVSSSSCGTATSTLNINFVDKPNAGINSNLTLCNDNASFNLIEKIEGNPDFGGIWTPQLASGTNTFNPTIDTSGTYIYTVNNGSCLSTSELNISITESPNTGVNSSITICKKSNPINLLEKVDGNPDLGGIWSPQLNSGTNIFNPSIDPEGLYTYTINNGICQSTVELKITLTDSISVNNGFEIDIVDFSNANTITINNDSKINYEYSLDNISFQASNVFYNLNSGTYTVSAREINGCNFFETDVFILDYPRFFTPNNDGVNDVWKIKGTLNLEYNLYIYDRYGNLLKKLDSINDNWNGNYNGNLMPSNDYWFKIVLENGRIVTGHFSLKRS